MGFHVSLGQCIFQVIATKVPYITMTDHIVLLRVSPLSLFVKH